MSKVETLESTRMARLRRDRTKDRPMIDPNTYWLHAGSLRRGSLSLTAARVMALRYIDQARRDGRKPYVKIFYRDGSEVPVTDPDDPYVICEDCNEVISLEEVSDVEAIGSVCSDCATAYDDPGFPSREDLS